MTVIIMTPRLRDLISALYAPPREQHNAIMRRFESEVLEQFQANAPLS
jgi:hypothetical protein